MDIKKTPKTVDEYIAGFPENVQTLLNQVRTIVKKAAPDAEEKISYGMPSYTLKGMLLYFAAHTGHLGLYPYPSAMEAFNKEIAEYRTSKGTIQFRYDKLLPLDLISQIVAFRVKENLLKAELKAAGKKTIKNKPSS